MKKQEENIVLCGANSYEQKYYLNQQFSSLPQSIKDELQIMCVLYTEEVGGILTMEFEPDGTLIFKSIADDMDYYYDDISAGLKIKQMQQTKMELLESLELYYRIFFLGEKPPVES
ncbi:MAG: DUF6145 family protein [Clostridiales bacterium]|nr:DUF6145 family protein [Clostridiales bacterium]